MLFSEPKIPQDGSSTNPPSATVVSVLFSEPKIPQEVGVPLAEGILRVSVLFSEPKIPQLTGAGAGVLVGYSFQCSSASRKFLK